MLGVDGPWTYKTGVFPLKCEVSAERDVPGGRKRKGVGPLYQNFTFRHGTPRNLKILTLNLASQVIVNVHLWH